MQADAILAMQLQRLTGWRPTSWPRSTPGSRPTSTATRRSSPTSGLILDMIRADLRELKDKYADPRRSVISDEELGDYDKEALIREEYMVVTVTHDGYIKRLPPQHLPRPGPRRPGDHRDQHPRGRLPRAHVRRPDARLHPVLHRPRQGLLAQGLRPAHGDADLRRPGHRQPAAARRGREDHRAGPGPRVPRGRVPDDGHPPRDREEDRADGLPPPAGPRHHRPGARRGRPAHRRGPDQGRRPGRPQHPRRHGDPVRRVRRPRHGPARPRRQGDQPRRRATRSSAWSSPTATTTRPAC